MSTARTADAAPQGLAESSLGKHCECNRLQLSDLRKAMLVDNLQVEVEGSSLGCGVAGVLPKDLSERSNATQLRDRTDRTKGGFEAAQGPGGRGPAPRRPGPWHGLSPYPGPGTDRIDHPYEF